MSIISRKNTQNYQVANVVNAIANVFSDHRGDIFTPEVASNVIGMESLQPNQLIDVQNTFENVTRQLEEAGLKDLIISQIGDKNATHAIDVAMESAAISLMASGSPEEYHSQFIHPRGGPSAHAVHVDTSVPGVAQNVPALESFTKNSFDKFAAYSVVVGALTLAQSTFDELFFPTEILSAGQSGAEIKLNIPYAFNRTKRATNGAPFQFEKKPLTHAIEDHTILEAESTVIYPHAGTGSNNDSYLVDSADVANFTKIVNNVDVDTRPLLFGKRVDLLGVSAHPGLVGVDQQDETDALDPNVNLGEVYVRVTVNDGAATNAGIFAFDVSGLPGSLFTRPAEGSGNDLTVNFDGVVGLNKNMKAVNGSSAAALNVHKLLNATTTDDWTVELPMNLTGNTNSERGNIVVYGNEINVGGAAVNSADIAKSSPEYAALKGGVTLELVGYMPKARRVNANLRMKGIFIDNGESNCYYFPITIGSPVASVHPVSGEGGGATVEGLVRALRIHSSNVAVSTLLNAENRIQQMRENGTVQTNASTIGTHFVRPSYLKRTLKVHDEVVINRSGEGYDDLRSFIVDELTTIADKLALESGYLSALENFVGADKEYEVIIGTDPRIAGLLMKSGDNRTLGSRHDFQIQSSLDKRMRGKIYVSFRRKTQKGIDPLSFGAHLSMPALVHEVANSSRGGATVQEVQVQPRELHTVTLPILGRIDIEQLDEFHKQT